MTSTPFHRIALSDPRAVKAVFPFDHLSLGEIAEMRRLWFSIEAGENGTALLARYDVLRARKYFPPVAPESPGEAA